MSLGGGRDPYGEHREPPARPGFAPAPWPERARRVAFIVADRVALLLAVLGVFVLVGWLWTLGLHCEPGEAGTCPATEESGGQLLLWAGLGLLALGVAGMMTFRRWARAAARSGRNLRT